MTLIIVLLLGASAILIISGYENTPLLDTITSVIQGKKVPQPQPVQGPNIGDIIKNLIPNPFNPSIPNPTVPGFQLPPFPFVPPWPGNLVPKSYTVQGIAGPGTFVGAAPATFSEWTAPIKGFITACVEVTGAILQRLTQGVQVTSQGVQRAADVLISQGQATAEHGTNFQAESTLLAGQGLQTQVVHVAGYTPAQLASTLAQYVNSGTPVGIGLSNATVLRDTLSGKYYDTGVYGHAAVVEGVDNTGAFVADPNTPDNTPLVHYTWQNLVDAHTDDLLVPQQPSGVLQ